ncbi:GNAT family N-acetyltransferase [Calothrix sp. 336/3]|uniref:GNAT family N-acetyltransferase n=1 Tax=Calothrix sp. 336/3 TaxID=1337936 RepID=UPI0009E29DE0|nr:GNAT family N-acetyltransferase [Calothrix sp. 336/3]
MQIETGRLLLRPLQITDLDDLALIYSDPQVMRYRVNSQPASRCETQQMLEEYIQHWEKYGFGRWGIIYKDNQSLIGHCGLEVVDNTSDIEINYLLRRAYWNQGLATEAAAAMIEYGFTQLKLERIVAIAQPENIASRCVMEKLGMRYENNVMQHNINWMRYVLYKQKWR